MQAVRINTNMERMSHNCMELPRVLEGAPSKLKSSLIYVAPFEILSLRSEEAHFYSECLVPKKDSSSLHSSHRPEAVSLRENDMEPLICIYKLRRRKDDICLLTLIIYPFLEGKFLQSQVGIGRKRTVRITLEDSYNMKSHIRCDHIAVASHSQGKCCIFDL